MAKKIIKQQEAELQLIEETKTLHQAAQAEANAEITRDDDKEKQIKQEAQEEKERLIAEAFKLTGKIEAFSLIAKFADVGSLILLKQIKENKIYKDMPTIETWENYCKSIGFSRSKIDEDLENLATFGERFLADVGTFGIGYRQLRQLKKATADGVMAIGDNSVIIEGETIPLDNKDELKEALEELVARQQKQLKEKDAIITQRETAIKQQENVIAAKITREDKINEEKEKAWAKADEYKKQLAEIQNGEATPIHIDDLPHFNIIRKLEDDFALIYHNICMLAEEELSPLNKQMLGGLIGLILRAADDTRLSLQCKSNIYFEGSSLTDAEMERLTRLATPADYLEAKTETDNND